MKKTTGCCRLKTLLFVTVQMGQRRRRAEKRPV
jgi:hypothetical protein